MDRVLISTITRDIVHAATAQWLCDQFYPVQIVHTPFTIEHNRNLQVDQLLASDYADWLFIVDNDTVPQQGTIEALLDSIPPMTCRVAPSWAWAKDRRRIPMAYTLDKEDGLYYPVSYNAQGVKEVDLTGMSGALIPRSLFTRVPRPWFKMTHTDEGFLDGTEDVYFWRKAKEAGYKIEAHLGLTAEHIKWQRI